MIFYNRFYIVLLFLLIVSFCGKNQDKLSKEEYKIINKTLNFYVDSLELCHERKTIVISDSTSLELSAGGLDVKEIFKCLNDTAAVIDFVTSEVNVKQKKKLIEKKIKLKGYKYLLKKETTMFEVRKDELYWQNIMKNTPDFCRYITFSRPLIKGNLAAIYIEGITTYNYGSGYRFLLTKNGKEWKVVYKKKVWIS